MVSAVNRSIGSISYIPSSGIPQEQVIGFPYPQENSTSHVKSSSPRIKPLPETENKNKWHYFCFWNWPGLAWGVLKGVFGCLFCCCVRDDSESDDPPSESLVINTASATQDSRKDSINAEGSVHYRKLSCSYEYFLISGEIKNSDLEKWLLEAAIYLGKSKGFFDRLTRKKPEITLDDLLKTGDLSPNNDMGDSQVKDICELIMEVIKYIDSMKKKEVEKLLGRETYKIIEACRLGTLSSLIEKKEKLLDRNLLLKNILKILYELQKCDEYPLGLTRKPDTELVEVSGSETRFA